MLTVEVDHTQDAPLSPSDKNKVPQNLNCKPLFQVMLAALSSLLQETTISEHVIHILSRIQMDQTWGEETKKREKPWNVGVSASHTHTHTPARMSGSTVHEVSRSLEPSQRTARTEVQRSKRKQNTFLGKSKLNCQLVRT